MATTGLFYQVEGLARRLANEALALRRWKTWLAARKRHAANIRASAAYFRHDAGKRGGRNVLLASPLPLPYSIKIEAIWAAAMAHRGYNPVCLHSRYSAVAGDYHRAFGTPAHAREDFTPWEMVGKLRALAREAADAPVSELAAFTFRNVPVGRYVMADNALSRFSRAHVLGEVQQRLAARLIERSCLAVASAERVLERFDPVLVTSVEKGFIGTCEIFHATLSAGVDYVQWINCHAPQTLMLKRYHQANSRMHPSSIASATWERFLAAPWDDRFGHEVREVFRQGYLDGRWFAYKRLVEKTAPVTREGLTARYGLDPGRKTAVIFSHILDDANLFYGKDLFDGGFAPWLVRTVEAAAANPRVNWVLKIHPANRFRRQLTGETGDYGEVAAIRQALGGLPDNVRLMLPEDNINPFHLFGCIDYGVTVRGTVGAELPCFGVPVVTGGTGRYSGLGFTEDSDSAEAYLDKIRNIETIPPLSPRRTELALRHAYLFFKVRPAPYDGFARDSQPEGGALFRDLEPMGDHHRDILAHPQLTRIMDWLLASRQEDFLNAAALEM